MSSDVINYINKLMKRHSWYSNSTFLIIILCDILNISFHPLILCMKNLKIYNLFKFISYLLNIIVKKYYFITICLCTLIIIILLNYYIPNNILSYKFKKNLINIPSGIIYNSNIQAIFLNLVDFTYFITVEFFRIWFILNTILDIKNINGHSINSFGLYITSIINIILSIHFILNKLLYRISHSLTAGHNMSLKLINKNYITIQKEIINNKSLLLIKPITIYNRPSFKNKYYYFVVESKNLKEKNITRIINKLKRDKLDIKNEDIEISNDKHNIKRDAKSNEQRISEACNYLKAYKQNKKKNLNKLQCFNYKILIRSQSFNVCNSFFINKINYYNKYNKKHINKNTRPFHA